MKNNAENKSKLFAQYWGQDVIEDVNNAGQKTIYPVVVSNMYRFEESKLLLKHLSSITDEHKIKVSLMFLEIQAAPFENLLFCFNNSIKPLLSKIDKIQARISDYLRSEGYALPFMGLSVEQQVEYGWIRLTQKGGEGE